MRPFVVGLLLSCTVLLSSGAPAAADDEPVADTIRDRAKQLSDVGVLYGRALGVCIKDTGEDKIERAKVAYVDVMLALRKAVAEVDELKFADTAEDGALRLAYEKFLKVQNDNCRTLGLDYLAIVVDENLTETERREKLMKTIERQVAIEKPHVEAMNVLLGASVKTDKPESEKPSSDDKQ
jgi:hypothetical protein